MQVAHSPNYLSLHSPQSACRRMIVPRGCTDWRNWTLKNVLWTGLFFKNICNTVTDFISCLNILNYPPIFSKLSDISDLNPRLASVISKSNSTALYSDAAGSFSCKQCWGWVERKRVGNELPLWAERPQGSAAVDYRKDQTLSYISRVCLDIVNTRIIMHMYNCAFMV